MILKLVICIAPRLEYSFPVNMFDNWNVVLWLSVSKMNNSHCNLLVIYIHVQLQVYTQSTHTKSHQEIRACMHVWVYVDMIASVFVYVLIGCQYGHNGAQCYDTLL